jgi:hypothetical protein
MDDVPIVTSQPVKSVFAPPTSTGTTPKAKPPGTFVNFFLMMPLAGIILIQAFYFGRSVGEYTTFPLFTVQSYLTLGAVLSLMILVQMCMRSIVYSTLFGFMLLSGILHAWFGDFWVPVLQNFKEVLGIMKSAWSKRDIPFPILMSTIITTLMGITIFANFIFSLFIKYFFEVVFGREWSDGRKVAFISTIIFMGIVQAGFLLYARSTGNTESLIWSQKDRYHPLEEFIARIPSAAILSKDVVCAYDPEVAVAYSVKDGSEIRRVPMVSAISAPTWSSLEHPVFPGKAGLVAFDKNLLSQNWVCQFPVKLPLETIPGNPADKEKNPDSDLAKENLSDLGTPLVIRTDISPDFVLAMFDYGFWGLISMKDGRLVWVRLIDSPHKVQQFQLEEFIRQPLVVLGKEMLVFACNNGRITAVKSATGEIAWEYMHKEAKVAGKGQRALLTRSGDRVVAAYASGDLITLDLVKGTKIYEARSGVQKWVPITPVHVEGGFASFISSNGQYMKVELDGGNVNMMIPLFSDRTPLLPAPLNLERDFAAFKDTIYTISSATRSITPVLTLAKHVFATHPVVDGNFLYIGTQDGWMLCMHKDSHDVRWKVRLPGELSEDSLMVAADGILVRTKSGSVFCLKKET